MPHYDPYLLYPIPKKTMCGTVEKNINSELVQVLIPEEGEPAHITQFGTADDNLADARELYFKDKQRFFGTRIGDRAIEDVNRQWNESAKVLERCAMGYFRACGATDEGRVYANQIMDMVTKDSDLRKKNMKLHFDYLLKKNPDDNALWMDMRKVMLECIHEVQRFTNSQSLYIRYYENGETFQSLEQKMDVEAAEKAERVRNATPEGCTYRPSYIYPPRPVPPGERVPDWPEPMNRVADIPIEEKVYDPEVGEFVLPEGYVSEDGLIDDKSVVWHPERREVDMGYVGGERVTWPYVKHVNTWDVWIPGSWEAEYQIRLYQQQMADLEMGLFKHRVEDEEEIPSYNRIPKKGE